MVLSDYAASQWDMCYEGYNLIIFRSKVLTSWALDSDIDPFFKGNCVNEITNFLLHGGVFKFVWTSVGSGHDLRCGVIDNISDTPQIELERSKIRVSGSQSGYPEDGGGSFIISSFYYSEEDDWTSYINHLFADRVVR